MRLKMKYLVFEIVNFNYLCSLYTVFDILDGEQNIARTGPDQGLKP